MKNDRPDVIHLLEDELQYHTEQIERIQIALNALKGEGPIAQFIRVRTTKGTQNKIPWTKKVMEVLDQYPDKAFETDEICNALVVRGMDKNLVHKNRPSIYSVLIRGIKLKRVIKVGHGRYRKFKREPVVM